MALLFSLRRAGTAGFTLVELLLVMVLVGIMAGLAAPRLDEAARRARARSALDQLSADLYYARLLAVREGRRTVVRFTRQDVRCHSPNYQVVVRADPERVAKRTVLEAGGGLCLQLGTVDSVAFTSRGLPAQVNNRKMYVRWTGGADSLRLSMLGRVYRHY